MRGSIQAPQHTLLHLGFELSADDVGCLEALRPLQQVKFDCFALIESAIAIFLDGGEVNENVFTRGPLDEAVSLGPVKPLYCTLLSHLNYSFQPFAKNLLKPFGEACASESPLKAGAG